MNRRPQTQAKMRQQELPFGENFGPGWQGKRYLFCTDGVWHLTLAIRDGLIADTQCGVDAKVVLPVPENDPGSLMCKECVALHFPPMK